MPLAVTNQEGERHELKSLPGAYVVLRRLTYGQKLKRLEVSSKMTVAMGKGKGDTKGELDMMQFAATFFDFQRCITEHNLEKDTNGTLLNFTSQQDFLILDPRVGDEISKLLDKMNNFEDDEESGNSDA
jgi:hypothetical protein